MKKKDIIDLIIAHYEDDSRLFFNKTIEILKEFKENGDDVLVQELDFILKGRVKLVPKREPSTKDNEISYEDIEKLNWGDFVPQVNFDE